MPVSSNTITFSVSPRISGVDLPDGDDPSLIRINIGDEFSVTDTTLEEDEAIQVIIDGLPYQRVADPPGNPQEFSVRDDGTIGNAIRINPHSELSQSGLHPLRVIVNGADSAPHWIGVPG